jgi:hypothetical protein
MQLTFFNQEHICTHVTTITAYIFAYSYIYCREFIDGKFYNTSCITYSVKSKTITC